MVSKAGIDMIDNKEFPYEVYHPEAQGPPPRFKIWKVALMWQNIWDKETPGHRARKRRITC